MEELIRYIKSHKQFYNKVIKKYITKEVEDIAIFYKLSIKELCYRIKHDISFDKVFKCKTCGKIIKFKRTHGGYQTYCSMSCMNKSQEHVNKVKQTCLRKYNTTSYAKTKECRDKMKQTCLDKYGVENYSKCQKFKDRVKQTCLDKYGVEYYSQSDTYKKYMHDNKDRIRKKREETNLKHFGVNYYTQTSDYIKRSKQTYLKKYGTENFTKTQEFKNKVYKTKQINNSFNKSSKEDQVYNLLLTVLDKNNIIRQYKSKKYPFTCDFYIPEKDLYIEYNGHWTHGNESFDKNNLEHQRILEEWKRKSEKSKFYKNAIYTWTDLDVRKLETFKRNNLNYKIFWNLEEVNDFIGGL